MENLQTIEIISFLDIQMITICRMIANDKSGMNEKLNLFYGEH